MKRRYVKPHTVVVDCYCQHRYLDGGVDFGPLETSNNEYIDVDDEEVDEFDVRRQEFHTPRRVWDDESWW